MVVSQLKLEPPLLQAILGGEVVIEGSSSFHFESLLSGSGGEGGGAGDQWRR